MTNSLRWKLLTWNALVLALLLAAFGMMLWFSFRQSMLDAADRELSRHAAALAGGITDADESAALDLDVPTAEIEYFRQQGASAPYYALWNLEGKQIDVSDPALDIPFPGSLPARSRGSAREVCLRTMAGATVLVGRNLIPEFDLLDRLGWIVAGSALTTLLLSLAGGWFLTGRALAPIDRITNAAERVSASNLDERIELGQMESELRRLAQTVNAAFDRLKFAFEQQGRFTADASHELRTPLSIILSHADSALSRERSPEEYRESLTTIRKAGLRMKSLAEGLLKLARPAHGSTAFSRIALDRIVHDTCQLLLPLLDEKNLRLAVNADSPIHVIGDRDRIGEAITNILANAVRYNRVRGSIDVSLHMQRDDVLLTVSDSGIGIPIQDQPFIFDRFYRVDKARSREIGGFGLGLSITRSVIESHGGSIRVQSDGATGSTFVITLPLANDDHLMDSQARRNSSAI